MRKTIIIFALIAVAIGVTSCQKKQEVCNQVHCQTEPVASPYQPVHMEISIDLNSGEKYHYFNAPTTGSAKFVTVKYDQKTPYAAPILVKYHYDNGDTYTYVIPSNFGLWNNEYGRLRVVVDEEATVWMQGQTKQGRFHEFIFYGNPAFNDKKIKPNSYYNHPNGVIKHK